jgi:hypothetical protein
MRRSLCEKRRIRKFLNSQAHGDEAGAELTPLKPTDKKTCQAEINSKGLNGYGTARNKVRVKQLRAIGAAPRKAWV